ncbi:MAG: P-II family nitrogen regulator [Pseudomonadota bacterium]
MKLITAIVHPHKTDDLRAAVGALGIKGMTVTEVKGFGRQRGHSELYRGAEYTVDYRPKMKIEVAVADDICDDVVDVIIKTAKSGKIGDGKIFVTHLAQVMRVRTGESDDAAL